MAGPEAKRSYRPSWFAARVGAGALLAVTSSCGGAANPEWSAGGGSAQGGAAEGGSERANGGMGRGDAAGVGGGSAGVSSAPAAGAPAASPGALPPPPVNTCPIPGGPGCPWELCRDDPAWRTIRGRFREIRSVVLSDDGTVLVIDDVQFDTLDGSVWRWNLATDSTEKVSLGRSARVLDTDARGDVVLGEDEIGDFLWRAGAIKRLPFDRHPWDCVPRLSRDGGSVVGCSGRRAVLVQDGAETVLESPAGLDYGMPLAINSDGSAVAGLAYGLEPNGDATGSTGVIWIREGGAMVPAMVGGYRAVAISDDATRGIVLTPVGTIPGPTTASLWHRDGEPTLLGGWDHAVATPDLSRMASAEGGSVFLWTKSSGVSRYEQDSWEATRVVQLALSGTRAIVEGRGTVCVSGTCTLQRGLWDVEHGWARLGGALSRNGAILARGTRCADEPVVARIDLTKLDEGQRSKFWSAASASE